MQKKLQVWVKGMCQIIPSYPTKLRPEGRAANYDTAMKAVAYTELLIMLRVLLGAVTFQNSLLSPVFYAHFLRARWYQSKFTQGAITQLNLRIEAYVRSPGAPPMLLQVYEKVQVGVSRWAGSVIAPQGAAAAGARRQ